jgi:hypothetical protein
MEIDPFIPYLAGIIDGEGCIAIRTDNNGELIIIRMRDCDVLALIQDRFGGSLIKTYDKKYDTYTFQYLIANIKANNLIKQVYPFLILKKENAKLCIQLRETINDFKNKKINEKEKICKDIREKMKLLNQRNNPKVFKEK